MERIIEKEGYIIFNNINKAYYDEDSYEENDFRKACIYDTSEEASNTIEDDMEYPNEYEIHKVKMVFTTEEVLKRKVLYEPTKNYENSDL
jgi:predicted GTPase